MKIFAYVYTDPLLEQQPDPSTWGLEIAQSYCDLAVGVTAGRKKAVKTTTPVEKRPQWRQLLQDCEMEPADWVVVRQLEDLGDSMQEVSDRLAELEALGIAIATLDDTSEASSELTTLRVGDSQADILQRLQVLQQNQRSRRIRQGHAQNRVKALPPPGKAPYGYRRGKVGYEVDRTTAPVVKDFFEQFLLYGSVRGAVRYLAKRYGKKVAPSTGQRWLTNPVYRGDLEYQDGKVIRDTHPAIISRDEAAQVDRLLRRNRWLPPRAASAPRSLAGLVKCSECQSSMTIAHVTTHNRKQEYLYLRPRNCPAKPKCAAIAYEEVLQVTIQRICEDLPRAVSGVELPDMVRIKQGMNGAIAGKQALLDQLPTLIASGVLDQETADLRAYKLRTEIAELQNQLSQLPPVDLQATAQTLSIPQFWLDLSETERRAYFREFLREIQLIRHDSTWELKLIFFFSP
ncbi:MAG: recombinase family protein [Oscillatoriales cyanobacterium C42_A2020_001]|nr:recombinase family protein [Leptolyngbyaceae cyanobacterium C42_A2020_001]